MNLDTEHVAFWIAGLMVAGGLIAFTALWRRVTDFTERHAAPARAVPESERTLQQKLAIEADRRADMINIEQYETFLTNFVASYITDILKRKETQLQEPMEIADAYVDKMVETLERRNPDLAANLNQTIETAKERLAGAVGKVFLEVKTAQKPPVSPPVSRR